MRLRRTQDGLARSLVPRHRAYTRVAPSSDDLRQSANRHLACRIACRKVLADPSFASNGKTNVRSSDGEAKGGPAWRQLDISPQAGTRTREKGTLIDTALLDAGVER
jgi:hypothetical protein